MGALSLRHKKKKKKNWKDFSMGGSCLPLSLCSSAPDNMSQSIQSKKRRSKCNMRSGDRTAANCAELFCRPTRCPLIRDEARFKSPGIFTCESKIQICTCREGRCPKKLDTQGQDWFCTSDFTGESDA